MSTSLNLYLYGRISDRYNRTKAHYRELEEDTVRAYRIPLLQIICMIVRFCHAENLEKTNTEKHKQRYGSFRILYSNDEQKRTAQALYKLTIQPGENEREPELMKSAHALLDTLWRAKNKEEGRITNPIDQSLCLSSLRSDNQWARANTFTRYCAQVQHGGYSVMTQIARLMHSEEDGYVPVTSHSSTSQVDNQLTTNAAADRACSASSIPERQCSEPDADTDADSNTDTDSNMATESELDPDSDAEVDADTLDLTPATPSLGTSTELDPDSNPEVDTKAPDLASAIPSLGASTRPTDSPPEPPIDRPSLLW